MSDSNVIDNDYSLSIPADVANKKISSGWLILAVSSMLIAGIFTVLVVLSRVPYTKEFFPWVDFFHTALVVHVDLTVLTWFLSYAGLFWSLNSKNRAHSLGWAGLIASVLGTLIIIVSPFLGAGMPFLNNYVPVLQDPLFYAGLGLFGLGFTLTTIRGLMYSLPVGITISGQGAIRFGLYTALVASIFSLLSLPASWLGIPDHAEQQYFFELLFWGAGHTLQFVHVQLVLVVWLCLATFSGITLKISPRTVALIFAIGLIPVLLTPMIYVLFDVASGNHLQAFTWAMQYGGGMAATPIALFIIYGLFTTKTSLSQYRVASNTLFFSFLLFGMGGVLGFLIDGSNTIVPAHYHGSITSITLAFMGITYYILPRLGYAKPQGRWVVWQPVVYGLGQLIHITGLALSGGHGVQRKTAGVAQGLDTMEKVIGMRVMGFGAAIAIIGGIIFLVIVFRCLQSKQKESSQ